MKIKYLNTSEFGISWFRSYYRKNPQLNIRKAVSALQIAERVLQDNPYAGELFEDYKEVREYSIQRTAFSLIYTIAADTVWIIDIRDQRGLRSVNALRRFNQELRKEYGLKL